MMKIAGKFALISGSAAMLLASPLAAADIYAAPHTSLVLQTANGHHGGWGHRNRVDAGDVLTGIGILAGIAIIADAASKSNKRDRSEPRYDDRNADDGYDRNYDRGGYQSNDIGSAVSACSDAAERGAGGNARVREIGSVTRDGEGWRVEGDLDGSSARTFDCTVSNGRVDSIQLDNRDI